MTENAETLDVETLDEATTSGPTWEDAKALPSPLLPPADGPVLDVDAAEESVEVDPFPSVENRPCFGVYDVWIERSGWKHRPGVYLHGMSKETKSIPSMPVDTWLCGPLHVEAGTANVEDADHGRLLRYRNASGNWRRWAMPMQLLAGDGKDVLATLLSDGLELDRKNRMRILDYINESRTKERMRAATSTGWHGDAFVLPDQVIGATDIWFQATERTAPYGVAGTLADWQKMAAMAVGNDLLALGVSAAFAGVLLQPLNIDGAGLHLVGDSSQGKTSILQAATSVWGGTAFRRTWRTTSNGLEGAARMHSGTLLALDEIGECNPKDLFESVYALANGHGKTRANVRGEARHVARWRVFIFSTGELSVVSRIAAGGLDTRAGQTLRLLDVPITGTYGAWNNLHGYASGAAFSDTVRDITAKNYGHAGPAFVSALIEDLRGGLDLSANLQTIVANMGAPDGQEARAARVFALCGLAGELATGAQILPWPAGTAIKAASHGFELWRNRRAAHGRTSEEATILMKLSEFIEMHGGSRFANIDPDHEEHARPVINRAGYYSRSSTGTLYLFTSAGMKEATAGYETAQVVRALNAAGALAKHGQNGRATVSTRTPEGTTPRLYYVDPAKLAGD